MGRTIVSLACIATVLAACTRTRTVIVADTPPARRASTAATLGIPPGHLPPPGKCRIWIAGQPPGHQPRPGSCSVLAARVPPNGWLVYRPSGDKKRVKVSVYDRKRPGVVVVIRFYDSKTGKLLREERPGR